MFNLTEKEAEELGILPPKTPKPPPKPPKPQVAAIYLGITATVQLLLSMIIALLLLKY